MEKKVDQASCAGGHLKHLVKISAFGGLFFSFSGTMFIWAGSDSFNFPSTIWRSCGFFNIAMFVLTWLAYIPFRNTDKVLGNGVLALFIIFSWFWMFGFAGFYFYFLFVPNALWMRGSIVFAVTLALIFHGRLILRDINEAFANHVGLLEEMFRDEGASLTFTREAITLLEKRRKDRNPFKSIHMYFALGITPFVLIFNRLMSPIVGDGHGVFLIIAFFAVPIMQWQVEVFVQTFVVMIYYPIKLYRTTGKLVLLKDW